MPSFLLDALSQAQTWALSLSQQTLILALAALLGIAALMMFASVRKQRSRAREEVAVQAMAAICYIVTAQPHAIAPSDIGVIQQQLHKHFGRRYTRDQLWEMLDYTASDRDILDMIGNDLPASIRPIIIETALRVATLSGPLGRPAYQAMRDISDKLNLTAEDIRRVLANLAPAQTA